MVEKPDAARLICDRPVPPSPLELRSIAPTKSTRSRMRSAPFGATKQIKTMVMGRWGSGLPWNSSRTPLFIFCEITSHWRVATANAASCLKEQCGRECLKAPEDKIFVCHGVAFLSMI